MKADAESLEATIDAAMATVQGPCNPTSTLVPATHRASDVLELLRQTVDRYLMGSTLGEGGMGIVHLAEQRALGREVAIKTLKKDAISEAAIVRLLQEAWVTGSLQHPNVVPVYDIDRDAEGRPRIVLKKIEGREWASLMHDADAIKKTHRADDPLEWNLRIVIEVCRALRFAHDRGFVHRDLKPENVMVGPFGEVYVLDWGIAVAMEDDGTGRFPLARDAKQMAGTPCYMAPEQLGGEEVRIGPRTDIYLVGAMLFEVLAKRPPHEGQNLQAILASVLQSPPDLPDEVPEDLARIVRRAMAADPDGRFENAEQLQLALEGFLRHRGSRQLTERADESAQAMVKAIDRDDDAGIEEHYAECAFGYRAALEAWPENESATMQLRRVTVLRIDYELERGEAAVAARLLTTLDDPPPALERKVSAARRKQIEDGHALRRLREDESSEIGRRTRTFLGFIVTMVWTLAPLSGLWIPLSLPALAVATTLFFAMLLVMGIWARDSMSRTRLNRQLGGAVVVAIGSQLCILYAGWVLGLDARYVEILMTLTWAIGAAFSTIILPGLWPAFVGFAATFVGVIALPEYRYFVMSAGNGVLMLTILWQNRAISLLKEIQKEKRARGSGERA